MDSYLSLLHLTAGIIVGEISSSTSVFFPDLYLNSSLSLTKIVTESVFNPYATASFVKFILFSIFEMRYLLFIFKARNPQTFAAGWRVVSRKLSQLYMRFCTYSLDISSLHFESNMNHYRWSNIYWIPSHLLLQRPLPATPVRLVLSLGPADHLQCYPRYRSCAHKEICHRHDSYKDWYTAM